MARSCPLSLAGVVVLLLSFSHPTTAGVMDNVNDGLKLAGQMFGINTAADVANLVAKAFSRATTRKKQPDLMSVLQQGFEAQRQQQLEQEVDEEEEQEQEHDQADQDQAEQGQAEQENAQESPPAAEGGTRRRPLQLNSVQMLTNMMRMIGFDPRKLGALALNAIVMIAQAIGSTIMQATRGGNNSATGPEALFEPSEHQPRSLSPGSPIDWFLRRPGAHTQRMLRRIMDHDLPEHVVDMIASKESPDGNEVACLKLLMCKSSPIIWGMQDSLKKRLAGEPEEPDEQSYMNANMFFKYLPSLSEFKEHGVGCETRFAKHCPRNDTLRPTPKY
ncbi:uncharacterized protein LOC6557503 [Drosophila grimshawi]|uniref:GH15174 n=1 Tax=Drosophila grimshawi TaxID=7222 RepID=B4IXV7_DROGR|nr:uncharacterized protein LOC6557503 [Drosophila grimshawi]EDV96478.1 GH15174 [Drosophila grimshawi]